MLQVKIQSELAESCHSFPKRIERKYIRKKEVIIIFGKKRRSPGHCSQSNATNIVCMASRALPRCNGLMSVPGKVPQTPHLTMNLVDLCLSTGQLSILMDCLGAMRAYHALNWLFKDLDTMLFKVCCMLHCRTPRAHLRSKKNELHLRTVTMT